MFSGPGDHVQMGEPVVFDDELFVKYRIPTQGDRDFWYLNSMEVWYEDERFYGALDEIQRLDAEAANV